MFIYMCTSIPWQHDSVLKAFNPALVAWCYNNNNEIITDRHTHTHTHTDRNRYKQADRQTDKHI